MTTPRRSGKIALLLTLLMGTGCGGEDSPQSSSHALSVSDRAARQSLIDAYRAAESARRDRAQCEPDPTSECDLLAYPPLDILVPDISLARLHEEVIVRRAATLDDVLESKGIYVIAEGTSGRSIALAKRTPDGSVWVLRGSASSHEIERAN